ncbi:MAG: insulinase family protein, partial [Planctomycetes bacterium]|nr:insulinase family protein [Planctomycetota bacterium]
MSLMKTRYSQIFVLFSSITLLTSSLGRAAEPPKKVTSVEGITEYNYDNGLRVLLFPDQSKPTVTVNTTYFIGSRSEGLGETGMAHLLEHLVFKGTPTFPSLWNFFDQHGARFNGSTWYDRTNYFETMPASDDNLDFGIHVAADCMINSFIQKSDLDTEMTVVRNEFEMGENQPIAILTERMENAAYLWHNYGKSTIGSKEDIERVPIANLKEFYKKYYQPDNAMVVIAGKFEPEKALALVDKYFAPIPKPTRTLSATYTVEPVQDGERQVILRRNGDVNAVGALYHICAGSHPDAAALDAVQHVLTNKPSGRLYKALVDGGLASNVFGNVMSLREPGFAEFMAQVRLEQDPRKALDKLTEVMEGFDKQPVTAEETERAKASLLKGIELDLTQSDSIGIELSEWAAMGDWRLYFIHRDRIKELKPEDLQRVASFYFTQSNRTSGLFLPTKTPVRSLVPEAPDVVALVKDYKGVGESTEGEAFDATAENIDKRTKRSELPSGMKLALLSKSTRGKAVQAQMVLHFGTEADLKGKTTALGMVPDMLMRGTSKHTFQQIRDEFDKLKARVNMGGGGGMRGSEAGVVAVNIETTNENLVPTLKLVHEILTDPVFPADEFDTLKKEQLARMEQQLSDPQPLAFVSMMRRLAPYTADDVRYVPTVAERIERLKGVTLDQVKESYKKFYGASHAEFAAVGDFDENAVKKSVEEMFAGWKSPGKFERVAVPFRSDSAAGDETILTPDKKMAIVCAGLNVELKDDDPDYAPVSVANHVLGASAKSRLLNRLRQKEGLSYGAGSMFQADAIDRRAALFGFAICATENADKAHDYMLEEFNKWYKEGITDEELTDAKTSIALENKNRLADDSYVAGQLARGLYVGRTMEYHARLDKQVQSVSKDQIQ